MNDAVRLIAMSGINLGDVEGVKALLSREQIPHDPESNLQDLRIEAFNLRSMRKMMLKEYARKLTLGWSKGVER